MAGIAAGTPGCDHFLPQGTPMKPFFHRVAWALLLMAPLGEAVAALRLELQASPVYTGTRGSLAVSFAKAVPADGITALPPFSLRVALPAGLTYRGFNGGNWSCPGMVVGATEVTCTYSGTLYPTQPTASSLGILFDTPAQTPTGPVTFTGTIASDQFPLPSVPTCMPTPSTTGCATFASSLNASSLAITAWSPTTGWASPGAVSVWTGPPLEAATIGAFTVAFRNIGYGETNTPVTVRFTLPAAVTYRATVNAIPAFACTTANGADGQVVTCTTTYMYSGQDGFLTIAVDVGAALAVPGPVFVHAAIGNNAVPAPNGCVALPTQAGCARLEYPTRPARVANLQFEGTRLAHAPAWFEVGTPGNTLTATFRNAGEAQAAATTLAFALPPGIAFGEVVAATPAFTCSTEGAVASGQRVVCSAAGLPATMSGVLTLRMAVDLTTERPGPVPVLGAIDASNPSTSSALATCVLDPETAACAWHDIPVWASCATERGLDTLYCDGFEEIWPSLD